MGGGQIQLSAIGQQDYHLTANPQITFFKSVFRRHTNFAKITNRIFFDGDPTIGFGQTDIKAIVLNENAFSFFENGTLKNEKLDLIFLDPPYKEENIKTILENIVKLKLLKESGLVVLHRHKKTKDDFCSKFTIKRSAKYGISKIIFLKIN